MERVAVIGLGYVGLPVALGFARHFPDTLGYDLDTRRVTALTAGVDATGEFSREDLAQSSLTCSSDPEDLETATFFVVCVPTPIDRCKRPDLTSIRSATRTVAEALRPGSVVVYESTVYPGVTEEICRPLLAEVSGLTAGTDFHVGYSPERINPGDRLHTLEKIVKVVSGEDEGTLERIARAYARVVEAGVHRAPSIQVAEAAKVIENTQRDLNIALMNELSLIFERLGIPTRDVLAAAGTKWNFLPFTPGLVGGHCIGVDPYYLTTKAQEVGYHPEVILAGRRINDGMGQHVAHRVVRALASRELPVSSARVGILGLTFKENVPDLRNSKITDIVHELKNYGIAPHIHDPVAHPDDVRAHYRHDPTPPGEWPTLDALILAVPHDAYRSRSTELIRLLRTDGILFDVRNALEPAHVPDTHLYLSL